MSRIGFWNFSWAPKWRFYFPRKKSFCNSSYETSTLACHSNQTFLYECRGQNFDLKYHHTRISQVKKKILDAAKIQKCQKSGDGEEGM